MPTVTIRPGAGDEETIAQTVGWERKRELGNMRRLMIDVPRADAQAVTLNRKEDLIQLGSIDTVRLVDIEKGGPTWTLVGYSLEWDANRVEPTAGGNLREDTDDGLITTLTTEVPTWSAGTINNFSGPLSFVFSHAHRHEILRRIERNVTGEVQFRDEGTVDYLNRLGTDKSASVELSASAGTIEKQIRVTERGREFDGTHIRLLGAHEGEAQLFTNLVPSDDGATYDNRVNYTTSRWASGDNRDWDRVENKDITDQATLDEEAESLAQEITESLVEVTTTTSTTDLSLGDTVQVVKPDADLDRAMRVHRITTKSGQRNNTDSGAAVVDELLLSTRFRARHDTNKDLRAIRQFNTGFQGSSVWGTPSGGLQAVDSGLNYQLSFFYPDVAFEHFVELEIKSLPYRAFSSGAADNNAFTNINPASTVTGGVTLDTAFDILDTFGRLSTASRNFAAPVFKNTSGGPITITVRLEDPVEGEFYPSSAGVELPELADGDATGVTIVDTTQATVNLELQAKIDSGTATVDVSSSFYAVGQHTHPVQPGVQEFPGETASGVDVIVNGSTIATDVGTGEFETEVDISGELTKGAWNDIEVASDSLGLLQCTAAVDAYRQIGTQ